MKKFFKFVAALTLCTSIIAPFSGVFAKKPNRSKEKAHKDVCKITEEEANELQDFIKSDCFFKAFGVMWSQKAEPDFIANPDLRNTFYTSILEFRFFINRIELSDVDKKAIKDYYVDSHSRMVSMMLKGEEVKYPEESDSIILEHAEHVEEITRIIKFLDKLEDRFNDYPNVRSYFLCQCFRIASI